MKLVHITRTIKIENKIVCLSKNRGWITASSSVRQSIGNESSNIMGEKESRSQGLIRFFLGCIPRRECVESRTWPLLDGGRGKRCDLRCSNYRNGGSIHGSRYSRIGPPSNRSAGHDASAHNETLDSPFDSSITSGVPLLHRFPRRTVWNCIDASVYCC